MKNIISLIIICFIGSSLRAQINDAGALKTTSIILERVNEPKVVQVTAIKTNTQTASEKMHLDRNNVQKRMERNNTAQPNVTTTATLALDKNMQPSKSSNINLQVNEATHERQSSPSKLKLTAVIANENRISRD